jgi:cytoskeletal protein RodZ
VPGKRAARPPKQDQRRRRLVGIVSAVVALALVGALALVLGRTVFSGGDDTPSASSTGTASDSPTPEPTASASDSPSSQPTDAQTSDAQTSGAAATTAMRACATEVSRAAAVVSAAAQGVTDWSSHVQARTDMLQGRISVDAMDAIWKRTRLAGPADQTRFKAARSDYHSTAHCAHLGGGSAAAACVARSKAATSAVAAAEAAMHDWESHLANMAMYANHQMSSVMAQTKWVSAWRNAPTHIDAYRSARAALDDAPACKVAG